MKSYKLTFFVIIFAFITACAQKKSKAVTSTDTISEKTLIDFFLPMTVKDSLVSEGIWGAENVLPRDINNGLEDSTLENWCYWDGSIVKDDAGTYHMYASHWPQSVPHGKGWHYESKAIHATSNFPAGPYKEQGLVYPNWRNGIGHNVVALRTHDGKYAVITSEITKGEIFIADNPDGPFKLLGEIKIDYNGYNPQLANYTLNNKGAVKYDKVGYMANVQILLRPDGKYMLIPRSTAPMISENGILGPYKILGERIYKGMKDVPQTKMEDPTVWYSGNLYHMIVNNHTIDRSYHFTSKDGIHNWKHRGLAFSTKSKVFKYTNGVVNEWVKVQRMTVYVEDGHPTHFLFSTIDVNKGQEKANDNHGSKIVVVPFDGKAFDDYMKKVVETEN